MALTLLELVNRACQVEDGGASRVDAESVWSTALKPSVATTSDFEFKEEDKNRLKSVEVDYVGDLMVRQDAEWLLRSPNVEEDKLVEKLRRKLENVGAFSRSEFVAMIRPALESGAMQAGVASGRVGRDEAAVENGAVDGEKASDPLLRECADEEVSFLRILRKGGPHVGRKLLTSIINCTLGLQFWNALKVLMECGMVTTASHPDLVPKLVENRKADFLCLCFHYVLDLTPSDIMMALKFLLQKSNASRSAFELVRQEWRRVASGTIDVAARKKDLLLKRDQAVEKEFTTRGTLAIVPAAEDNSSSPLSQRDKLSADSDQAVSHAVVMALAVDGFEGWETCMHALVASGQDEAILTAIIAELDTSEAVQLLQYLRKWLERYSNRLSRNPSPKSKAKRPLHNVPSSHQVLQWVGMVLDGQYTKCVLSAEFLPELRSIQKLVESVVAIGKKLTPLLGVTEHLRGNHPLPARPRDSAGNSDYTIEYLDIS